LPQCFLCPEYLFEIPQTARGRSAESLRLGPDFHNDPADRIIVAAPRIHGLPLMTADERIRKRGKVQIV